MKRNDATESNLIRDNCVIGSATRIGANLETARKKAKLTQKMVGDKLCIHPTQLAHFESGRRAPSLMTFLKLCEFYNVLPGKILEVDITPSGLLQNNIIDNNLQISNHLNNESEDRILEYV